MSYTNTHTKIHTRSQALSLDAHFERLSDHDYALCAGYVLAHFERLFDDDYVRCAGNVLCGGSL